MQDTLIYIIKNIVTTPDDVKVDETLDETGTTTYLITVNPTDVGRIIGKEGKIIKAIRTIMRVIAIQKGVHVRISVVSENDAPLDSTQDSAPVADEVIVEENEDTINVEV